MHCTFVSLLSCLLIFHDLHSFFSCSYFLSQYDDSGVKSINELQERIRAFMAINPPSTSSSSSSTSSTSSTSTSSSTSSSSSSCSSSSYQLYQGEGWEHDTGMGRYPTKADLDQVITEHPCILWRVCSHICVVNR